MRFNGIGWVKPDKKSYHHPSYCSLNHDILYDTAHSCGAHNARVCAHSRSSCTALATQYSRSNFQRKKAHFFNKLILL